MFMFNHVLPLAVAAATFFANVHAQNFTLNTPCVSSNETPFLSHLHPQLQRFAMPTHTPHLDWSSLYVLCFFCLIRLTLCYPASYYLVRYLISYLCRNPNRDMCPPQCMFLPTVVCLTRPHTFATPLMLFSLV